METTDYASYDLALKLKACGFDEPCGKSIKIIPGTEREEWDEEECQWCTVQDIEYYPKISLWQAQKWLREKKGIAINVIAHDGGAYDYDIVFLPNAVDCDYPIDRATFSRTYEEALSEGIASLLELIKEGE